MKKAGIVPAFFIHFCNRNRCTTYKGRYKLLILHETLSHSDIIYIVSAFAI